MTHASSPTRRAPLIHRTRASRRSLIADPPRSPTLLHSVNWSGRVGRNRRRTAHRAQGLLVAGPSNCHQPSLTHASTGPLRHGLQAQLAFLTIPTLHSPVQKRGRGPATTLRPHCEDTHSATRQQRSNAPTHSKAVKIPLPHPTITPSPRTPVHSILPRDPPRRAATALPP
jgi:hypothetical protein